MAQRSSKIDFAWALWKRSTVTVTSTAMLDYITPKQNHVKHILQNKLTKNVTQSLFHV